MLRGQTLPYYQALNRPFLILGANKQLFYLAIITWLPLMLAWRLHVLAILVGLIILAVTYGINYLLTRMDYEMFYIYKRQNGYRAYYAVQSGLNAGANDVKSSVGEV